MEFVPIQLTGTIIRNRSFGFRGRSLAAVLYFIFNSTPSTAQVTIDTIYENDRVKSVCYRNNGILVKAVFLNEDKSRNSEFHYRKDLKHGVAKWFYPDGSLQSTGVYSNDLLNGEFINYYESGAIQSVSQYKNGYRYGPSTSFTEDGKKYLIINYSKNKADGLLTFYYENGNIQYTGNMKKGKMSGERMAYDESGKPLNGLHRTYIGTTKEYRECNYINGKPEGEMKVVKDSTLFLLVHFKNGNPDGSAQYYEISGQDSVTEIYKDGVFIKQLNKK
jgi:antitoxin component YwqK of YwqJK toxin-antitoxin module